MESNSNSNSNSDIKSSKEYLEYIKTINLLNSTIMSNDKKLLLSVKINHQESLSNCECIFKILEKDKIWTKTYSHDQFKEYIKKMGFDGSWKAFFRTLELALTKTEGGDLQLKYPKTNKDNLILAVFHPLSEELKVKSEIEFELEKSYKNGSEDFRNLNFDFMLELYESKELSRVNEREKVMAFVNKNGNNNLGSNNVGSNNNNNKSDNISNGLSVGGSRLEVKKNQKRKFNSNIINPNVKKRNAKGAMFISEENDEEGVANNNEES